MFRVNPKNGNVHLVRKGPPLDEMYGIDLDSNGKIFLPASPDTDGDYDVWRMKTSAAGLRGFDSARLRRAVRRRGRRLTAVRASPGA